MAMEMKQKVRNDHRMYSLAKEKLEEEEKAVKDSAEWEC